MILMLTGVSGSGKTTLITHLVNTGQWYTPTNFTTRSPRNEAELDDYVFCTPEQFNVKLQNNDFCETTNYNGNSYGLTRHLDREKDYVLPLNPEGLTQMVAFCEANGYEYKKVFIHIDMETMVSRLTHNRPMQLDEIQERLEDFKTFLPDPDSLIVDGLLPPSVLMALIENDTQQYDFTS